VGYPFAPFISCQEMHGLDRHSFSGSWVPQTMSGRQHRIGTNQNTGTMPANRLPVYPADSTPGHDGWINQNTIINLAVFRSPKRLKNKKAGKKPDKPL